MTSFLYIAPDRVDPAVRRRIDQLRRAGATVTAFAFIRDHEAQYKLTGDDTIILGTLKKRHYFSRIPQLLRGFARLIRHGSEFRGAGAIIARNPDLLLVALAARFLTGSRAEIIYEVLDIRRRISGKDAVARGLRLFEGFGLRRAKLLVVSSNEFIANYYARYFGAILPPHVLLENRLYLDDFFAAAPGSAAAWKSPGRSKSAFDPAQIHLGWVGGLRCAKSAELLREIARRARGRVAVHIHGRANFCSEAEFRRYFAGEPNVNYYGPYGYPADLLAIYGKLDLNWCFDLSDAGQNAAWLLPNRIYEGGYFAVPHLGEKDTETGRYMADRGIGWTFGGDLAANIANFLNNLNAQDYAAVKRRCVSLMDTQFHYQNDIGKILERLNGAKAIATAAAAPEPS